jgi:hypothetical protein
MACVRRKLISKPAGSNPSLGAGQLCHTRNNLAFYSGHSFLFALRSWGPMVKVAKTSLRAAAVTAAMGILVVGIILA